MTRENNHAPYASDPALSRGRHHNESESATRSCFQRDRDRIIHSAAFRRLQYKTQVFVNHEGDFFRTRLTHSLEVSQIARSICRSLRLNEDLGEALALAHDLGHPPFGHAGEDALQSMMEPYGGFDHNAQSLRVVTRLESRYADFDGLNLTWETLEGLVKHNGPLKAPVPCAIAEYNADHDLELATHAGPEAQVAAHADDIAYNNHDIDDGLRAGLFTVADLMDVPLAGPAFAEVRRDYPDLSQSRLIYESIRRMIGTMIEDFLTETRRRLTAANPASADDVRAFGRPVAGFSDKLMEQDTGLRAFLFENMYRHYRVNRMTGKSRRLIRELFTLLTSEPQCLPTDWRKQAEGMDEAGVARLVTDYIAGMTDRFALDEQRKLLDPQSRSS